MKRKPWRWSPNVYERLAAIGGLRWLTESDLDDFNAARERVLALMLDQEWHYDLYLTQPSKSFALLRRLDELRALGLTIDVDRDSGGSRSFRYRLVVAPSTVFVEPVQGSLL